MKSTTKVKPFEITKREVFNAWKRVKANKGAAGVDEESIAAFECKLPKNLYKLWNRMSSGSYFPQAVRRVEIPKKDGSTRPLGIPTVYDRIAQEVVRARLEVPLELIFHKDSYGYRPGKSAIDAVRSCRERNWKYDWVLDVDIQKFFDTIPHELLLKAVHKHCTEKWMVLYIERWLKAPIQHQDGSIVGSEQGTPQGGVISPLLANLYLHYAFDKWMEREHPTVKFERYADDLVCHCTTQEQAYELKQELDERLKECGLTLHPDKTKVVYCKDSRRSAKHPDVSFTFLGYTFQPRHSRNRSTDEYFTGFLPAASKDAQKNLRRKLREFKLARYERLPIHEVAKRLNPLLRGWFNYFSQFYRSALSYVYFTVERRLTKWVKGKYGWSCRKATMWLQRLKLRDRRLFAHWEILGVSKC